MTRTSLSATPLELPDTLEFMQALWALAHALDRGSKGMARGVGVTGPQRLVLRIVGLRPGISAGELAAVLHLHKSTISIVVQRLIKQGLLTRGAHRADARRAVLQLTARGAGVNATDRGTVEAAVVRALGDTAANERAVCLMVLGRVTRRLEEGVDGTRPQDEPRAARKPGRGRA